MEENRGQEKPEDVKTDQKRLDEFSRPMPRDLEKFPAVYKKQRNIQSKRIFRCIGCLACFLTPEELADHLSTQHTNTPHPTFVDRDCFTAKGCLICDFSPNESYSLADKRKALEDHIIKMHFRPQLPPLQVTGSKIVERKSSMSFQCNICLKDFNDEDFLNNHMSLVCKASFQCDHCTFNFEQVQSLADHVRKFHSSHSPMENFINPVGF